MVQRNGFAIATALAMLVMGLLSLGGYGRAEATSLGTGTKVPPSARSLVTEGNKGAPLSQQKKKTQAKKSPPKATTQKAKPFEVWRTQLKPLFDTASQYSRNFGLESYPLRTSDTVDRWILLLTTPRWTLLLTTSEFSSEAHDAACQRCVISEVNWTVLQNELKQIVTSKAPKAIEVRTNLVSAFSAGVDFSRTALVINLEQKGMFECTENAKKCIEEAKSALEEANRTHNQHWVELAESFQRMGLKSVETGIELGEQKKQHLKEHVDAAARIVASLKAAEKILGVPKLINQSGELAQPKRDEPNEAASRKAGEERQKANIAWWEANKAIAVLDGVVPDPTFPEETRILAVGPASRLSPGGVVLAIKVSDDAGMVEVKTWAEVNALVVKAAEKTIRVRWQDVKRNVYEFNITLL